MTRPRQAGNAPHYLYKGKHLFVLDESEIGQMMGKKAIHLMGVIREDGQFGIFAADPEFLAEVIASGERIND